MLAVTKAAAMRAPAEVVPRNLFTVNAAMISPSCFRQSLLAQLTLYHSPLRIVLPNAARFVQHGGGRVRRRPFGYFSPI